MPQPNFAARLKRALCAPLLSSLMQNRVAALVVCGVAVLQGGLALGGLPGWQCPLLQTTGIPCPGCGLSRAVAALLQGDWPASLIFHAFAPLLLLALALISCAALLPAGLRQRLRLKVETLERRTGMTGLLLVGMVIYWLLRLGLSPAAFIRLING